MSDQTGNAPTWYEATCHCKACQFKCLLPKSLTDPKDPYKVNDCNCSVCIRLGYLLVYPKQKDIIWHHGKDHTKVYQFASKTSDHLFCTTCGSSLMIDFKDGEEVSAVNARLFKGITAKQMTLQHCEGRNEVNAEFNDEYEI